MARFCMRTFVLVALPVALMACAQGFEGNGDDDDDQTSVDGSLPIDARIDAPVSNIDAPVSNIDAPVSNIDAPTSSIDAGGGTGQVGDSCTASSQCDQAMALCCSVLGVCFIDPDIAGFCL